MSRKSEIIRLGGEVKEIMYDKKIKKLNVELAKINIAISSRGHDMPLILFEDWTQDKKIKHLFTLHIKEAIELKAILDKLLFDYLWEWNK